MFLFDEKNTNNIFGPNSLEHAYISILADDLDSARSIFILSESPRTLWGFILCDIISGYLNSYPTYFQLRNFLEIDLEFLIKNNKMNYVEKILQMADLLSNINIEVYKYIAKVMLENKLYNIAEKYMNKSKEIFYKDPEIHFILAKYYSDMSNYKEAINSIENCLKILPEYYPAILIKKDLVKYLV